MHKWQRLYWVTVVVSPLRILIWQVLREHRQRDGDDRLCWEGQWGAYQGIDPAYRDERGCEFVLWGVFVCMRVCVKEQMVASSKAKTSWGVVCWNEMCANGLLNRPSPLRLSISHASFIKPLGVFLFSWLFYVEEYCHVCHVIVGMCQKGEIRHQTFSGCIWLSFPFKALFIPLCVHAMDVMLVLNAFISPMSNRNVK